MTTIRFRCLTFLFTLLCLQVVARGSGWSDFELPIDSEYSIVRANAQDIVLCRSSIVIVDADQGPIVEYAVTPTHIFTHHRDDQVDWFYVVRKDTAEVVGPFAPDVFQAHPVTTAVHELNWQVPRNPNPEQALAGKLMFLPFALVILLGPPALLAIVFLLFRDRWRRRKLRGFEVPATPLHTSSEQ